MSPRTGTDAAALMAVADLVSERTGLSFPASRWEIAEAGIGRIRSQASARTTGELVELLRSDERVFDQLVAELTVGETYFFRDPAQFEFLRSEVLPAAAARGAGIRAWSAGCATGEEPFSISMLLHREGWQERAAVLGTDISRPRLARARRGVYSRWSLRGCPDEIVSTYFTRVGRGYALDPVIRESVRFDRVNLGEAGFREGRAEMRDLDLVLCRNVLIYLDQGTIARVAAALLDSLRPEGWLLLGASDPPLQGMVPCHAEMTDAGVAYQRARRTGRPGAAAGAAATTSRRAGDAPAGSASTRPTGGATRSGAAGPSRQEPADRRSAAPPRRRRVGAPGRAPRARGAAATRAVPAPAAPAAATAEGPLLARARALLNQRDLAGAESVLAEAAERHPSSAETAYLRSVVFSEQARVADAVAAARAALYLDRGLIVAHVALGQALTRAGDRSGAERAFRNAAEALGRLAPDAVVPQSDGELAGNLAELVRAKLRILSGRAGR